MPYFSPPFLTFLITNYPWPHPQRGYNSPTLCQIVQPYFHHGKSIKVSWIIHETLGNTIVVFGLQLQLQLGFWMGLIRNFAIHIIKLLACVLARKLTLPTYHIFARMYNLQCWVVLTFNHFSYFFEISPRWDFQSTCQHQMTKILKTVKKKKKKKGRSGSSLRDPHLPLRMIWSDWWWANLTTHNPLQTPFNCGCKSTSLNLHRDFSSPYSPNAQSLGMSQFSL